MDPKCLHPITQFPYYISGPLLQPASGGGLRCVRSKKVSENFSSMPMMLASKFDHILFSQSWDFSLVYLNAESTDGGPPIPPQPPPPVRGAAVFSHLAVVPRQQRLVSVPSNRPICLARADNEPAEVTAEVSPTPSPTPLPPRRSVSAASASGTLVSVRKDENTSKNCSNKMSTYKAGRKFV